jgi:hypothetical protein|tara:strand:- start:2052 stop:2453 length:402 start_codon:yes stop_codon:yes gene_type:complete
MATVLEQQPDTGEILEAIDTPDSIPQGGNLKINRRKNKGEFVEISIDPERLFPIAMKALLGACFTVESGADLTLDFLAEVQRRNKDVFPKDEMVRLLAEALEPFKGRITYGGPGVFAGDKLLNYMRPEAKERS